MTMKSLSVSLFALALGLAVSAHAKAQPLLASPASAIAQEDHGGWDVPPAEFRDIQRKGFHDGIEGARKDFNEHRRPDVDNRAEYRHPHVDASAREDYREGFRRGYETAMNHLMNDHDHDRH